MRKILLSALLIASNLLIFEANLHSQCTVSAGGDAAICAGQSYKLNATVSHGSPTNYAWTTIPPGFFQSGQSITVSPTVTTTYVVSTSGHSCFAYDTITLTVNPSPAVPSFTFSPNNGCSGSSVYFSVTNPVAGLIYTWNFGDGITSTGTSAVHRFGSFGTGTGTFTVTLTASNTGGCGTSSQQTVTVTQGPDAELIAGPSVDTMTFSGYMTFYQCASAAQQNTSFTFINAAAFVAGSSYTIIWGDGTAAFTTTSSWTSQSHTYARGLYTLNYIINPNDGSCGDTSSYRVFFGSNPAGGIASLGNTDICGPGWQSFILTNYQNNSIGTVYTVTFNDGSPPLVFSQPPPDTVSHYFSTSSCGVTSTDGVNIFNNAYSVSLTIKNPCGTTAGAVEPIYVSVPPIADYAPPGVACTGLNNLYVNTTKNGLGASQSGCDKTTPILWRVIPATGWTVSTGSLGDDNGFTGSSFDPGLWTSGSNTLGLNFTTPGNYQVMLIAANNCGPDSVIKTTCVIATPSPTISLGSGSGASGCSPVFDSIINVTPPSGGICGGTTFAWSISQVSSSCNPDSSINYKIINASAGDSIIYVEFYNQGVYNITLNGTNSCGTFSSAPQAITVNTTPALNLGGAWEVCSGQPFIPSASPLACGGTISGYSWSFPGGTPVSSTSANPGNISYPEPGNYNFSLSVTNECGTADTNAAVVVDNIPTAQVGSPTQTCSGIGVQIGATAVPGLSYSWSPPSGLSSPTVSNPTVTLTNVGIVPIMQTYYLTVSTPVGCSNTDSVVVTIWPGATVNAGANIGVCAGQSINLNGSFGGSATSVTWTSSNGGTFSDFTAPTTSYTPSINSGTVTLTLTTNKPSGICPAVSSTTKVTVVAPPTANAGSAVSVCGGASVQIGSNPQPGYTYLWSPSTGLDSDNISNPTVTLPNNTSNNITQTYTLNVSAVGCSDSAQVVVTVYPGAGVNAGPPVSTCAGVAVTLNGSISGAATTVGWTSVDGTFGNPDSLTTLFTPTIDSGIAVVVITSNQTSGICQSVSDTLNIPVAPGPHISITPTSQVTCGTGNSKPVQITADPGSVINWTVSSTNNITGYIKSGTTESIPAQALTDTSSVNQGFVIYSITATGNGCTTPATGDTIFVNPPYMVNSVPPQTICSGGTTTTVSALASQSGISFSWQAYADGNMSGFSPSGNDSIPAQTIDNAGAATDSVIFAITPTSGGCSSTPVNFNVYVNPLPKVNLPAAQIICSGTSTDTAFLSSAINGTTFTWTTQASHGVTGYVRNGSGNIPAQVIYNSDTVSGTVIYNITPKSNGCAGPKQFYIITVLPAPTATALPASDTLCTGVQTNIAITSSMGGTSFSWTVNVPPGITGASAGSGDTIQQMLLNNGQNPETVTYYVFPVTSVCAGPVDTVPVLVTPGTIIQFSPGAQSICSNTATQFVNISSATPGAIYTWVASSNGIGGVITSGIDSIPSQILVNNSGGNDTAKYLVSVTGGGCPGETVEYDIIVQSSPSVILPGSQSVCSGNPIAPVVLQSNSLGATFTWTATSPDGVTGYTPSGSSTNIPADTLVDTSATANGSVIYTIQAISGICQGPTANYTVQVSPALTVNPIAPQSFCSGDSSQSITPVSNNNGVTFNWQASAGPNIQGFTASGTGVIPTQKITNFGPTVDSIVYTITPVETGCSANPVTATIVVNPIPVLTLPAGQEVCNGQPTAVTAFYSNVAGTTYTWTATAPPGLSGYDSSGTGNIRQQFISNADTTIDTVSFTVVPSDSGCIGLGANYQIAVKPGLGTIINIAADTICAGMQTNIQLSSNMPGTTFTWLVNAGADIAGSSNGSGDTIQQMLTNNGTGAEMVTYIISSSASTCSGLPDSVNVVVNPILMPQLSMPAQLICSGQSTQAVNITLPGGGATLSWTANANGVGGVVTSGTGTIPVQTLVNSGSTDDTVIYTIAPSNASCASLPGQYYIIVRPNPTALVPTAQTICSGATTDSIVLSSAIPGTTFSWFATSTGVTGFMPGGNSSVIPPQLMINSSDTSAAVLYTITPSNGLCSGNAANYNVTVSPQPDVILPAAQTVCNGASTAPVSLNSHTTGVTFTWTSASDKGVTGETFSGSGDIPSQTLFNSGAGLDSVTYVITPQTNACTGASANYNIYINPVPQIIQPLAPQVLCSGQASDSVVFTTAMPGMNVAWTANIPNGITGAIASGSSGIPSQILNNNTLDTIPQVLTITYNIQVSYASVNCPAGTTQYNMSVKPKPQADFSLSNIKGCSPLNVNVIPNTMNYGVPDSLVFNWGDGSAEQAIYPNASTPLWPSLNHTFYNNSSKTETYNITMKAPGTCANLNVAHPVNVLPGKISAFFTASPASGCEPLTVTFHDQSVGAGTLSWCFNFVGDSCAGSGVVDTAGSTLTHTFNAGTYKVALYATNGAGCAQDTVYQNIQVTAAPKADFVSSNGPCADKAVNFTQQVSVPAGSFISQYQWSFGDNDSSLTQNPSHVYDTAGTYTVCLSATSSFGCSNQVCHPVTVASKPSADFTCSSACVNMQGGQFTSTSEGANVFQWSFGDGAKASVPNPVHDYLQPGNYTVTLIALSNTCSDTITHPVTIYAKPEGAFSLPQTFSCGLPSSVHITNATTGALSYTWDFGNGTTSGFTNPDAVFTAEGTYTITLVATSQNNCPDTVQKQITIYPYPSVQSINVAPADGCQPLNVQFFANATNASSFVWNFGDGTRTTTTVPNTSHLYVDTGTYSVVIQVYSYTACGDTLVLPDTVHVQVIPTAAFNYLIDDNADPYNGTVQFVNNSVNSTSYSWNFGDGSTSTDFDPSHMFANIDNFQVMLIAMNGYGCRDTAIQDVYVIKKSLYVPNVFAPGFSGTENLVREWKPAGTGLSTYHAQIFDKWGELLWESTAITADHQPLEAWDGSYQGKMCQQDVYVWKIEATFIDGTLWKGMSYPKEPLRKTIGSVTIVR